MVAARAAHVTVRAVEKGEAPVGHAIPRFALASLATAPRRRFRRRGNRRV